MFEKAPLMEQSWTVELGNQGSVEWMDLQEKIAKTRE